MMEMSESDDERRLPPRPGRDMTAKILPPIADPVARRIYQLTGDASLALGSVKNNGLPFNRVLAAKTVSRVVEVITISDDDDDELAEPPAPTVNKNVPEAVNGVAQVKEEPTEGVEKNNGAKRMKLIQVDVDKSEARSSKSPSATSGNTKEFDSREASNDFHETLSELRDEDMKDSLSLQFGELLLSIGDRLNDEEISKLQIKFRKRLDNMDPNHGNLKKLSTLIKLKTEVIKESPSRSFSTLQTILNDMRSQACVSKKSGPSKQTEQSETGESSNSSEETKHQRKIAKLENALKFINKEIHKAESKEMTLDDLDQEDSSYIYLDKLRNKYVQIFRKLMETRNESWSLGRAQEKKFKAYDTSQFPVVSEQIESLINKRRIDKKFPNYSEIYDIYSKCNSVYNMDLTNEQMTAYAKETFVKVGEKLQQRRKQDEYSDHNGYLDDDYAPEPIDENDQILSDRLNQNKAMADQKTAQVLEEFSQKQDSLPAQDGTDPQASDKLSEECNEESDNDSTQESESDDDNERSLDSECES